ncbi:hypothetical protein AB1Y20_016942 [Prymnesium parvum]|uniref:Uncharacterized protein n=1 Tax=Prymnesium parvum TaxID=97485 RepID=A0AB34IA15_PRYPA
MAALSLEGLHSPGPIYTLPSSFAKASIRSRHPTWGHHGPTAMKQGRQRCEEVRFYGRGHLRELQGHFSPGPQYSVPGSIGGAAGNYTHASVRLAAAVPHSRARQTLCASALGGTACFTHTRGSFTDEGRIHGFEPAHAGTNYWRSATMLQPEEPELLSKAATREYKQTWHESAGSLRASKVQDELKRKLAERSRTLPKMPFRQVQDYRADPPLASVLGSATGHSDFGVLGGMDLQWRESKIQGYTGGAPRMGPPPKAGRLRYAFVQPMGPNSVPRDAAVADVDGGRITHYAVQRPHGEVLSKLWLQEHSVRSTPGA